jgi:hypothetical protein
VGTLELATAEPLNKLLLPVESNSPRSSATRFSYEDDSDERLSLRKSNYDKALSRVKQIKEKTDTVFVDDLRQRSSSGKKKTLPPLSASFTLAQQHSQRKISISSSDSIIPSNQEQTPATPPKKAPRPAGLQFRTESETQTNYSLQGKNLDDLREYKDWNLKVVDPFLKVCLFSTSSDSIHVYSPAIPDDIITVHLLLTGTEEGNFESKTR